ncbi:MAG: hypothetical protein UW23_C0024G0005 [Candidatus Collierbacteria bacterium GW2011_GWA1_44_12]|uniref:Uncharacterized protein n=2 Tax=Candidatus Collieribacteriota TaxID=1752725 RepID=A0A0G1GKF1_9BACT|nr:MAG: hypothetical protein UW23_C0024G0005 [Candidatus Collierbacteria bacterium GW2011_GWA1_44_12]
MESNGLWDQGGFLTEMRKDTEKSLVVFVNEISGKLNESELIDKKRAGVKKEGARSVALLRAAEEDKESVQNRIRVLQEELDLLRANGMENMANRIQEQIEGLSKTAERALDRSVRAGESAAVDPKTGLATGEGLIGADAKLMMRIWDKEEKWDVMEDTVEIVMDMMLFHRGVEELGEEFDDRIKLMASGLISVAEYLAEGEGGIYSEMDESGKEANVALNLYFPEGSKQRGWLDELKELGVKFEPGRLNPGGGDEFIMRVDLNMRSEPMNKRLGERKLRLKKMVRVMDWVIKNTTFSKDRPVLLGEDEKDFSAEEKKERMEAYTIFRNYINNIVPSVNSGEGVSSEQSRFIWDFKDELRRHFESVSESIYFQPGSGLLDPKVELRMDYCQVGTVSEGMPVMEEVVNYFESNRPLGDQGSSEYEEFVETIKIQLAQEMDEDELKNSQLLIGKTEELIYRAVFEKYQRHLFGEVNGEWKGRKKLEVMTMAMMGDAQSIYAVGSVGRTFLPDVGDGNLKKMWSTVMRHWTGKFSQGKIADEGNSFSKYLSEMVSQGPDGRENWKRIMGIE